MNDQTNRKEIYRFLDSVKGIDNQLLRENVHFQLAMKSVESRPRELLAQGEGYRNNLLDRLDNFDTRQLANSLYVATLARDTYMIGLETATKDEEFINHQLGVGKKFMNKQITNSLELMKILFYKDMKSKGIDVNQKNALLLIKEHSQVYAVYTELHTIWERTYAKMCSGFNGLEDASAEMEERINDKQLLIENAYYFQSNAAAILSWEPWKGNIDLDMGRCLSFLQASFAMNYDGSKTGDIHEFTIILDQLRKFRSEAG